MARGSILEAATEDAARRDRSALGIGLGEDERELITADPEARIRGTDGGTDQQADLHQEVVANGVAAGIVDALELIDVEHHEPKSMAVAARPFDHSAQ